MNDPDSASPSAAQPSLNPNVPKVFDVKPVAVELEAGDHWWCACGLSAHQPMCDGSHKGSGIGPKKFTLTEKKTVWLCNCKQTKNPPYCDGSHKGLTAAATTA